MRINEEERKKKILKEELIREKNKHINIPIHPISVFIKN